jgi:hypothetical protein
MIKPIRILKNRSVQFYKPGTEKTKPNPNRKKPEPNWKKPSQNRKNQVKPI